MDTNGSTAAPAAGKILLANPRGFCAGVGRAIDIVDDLLALGSSPLYVRKEIVHNRDVVERFRARGVVFVDDLDEVPDGATVVFSAHGVAPSVRDRAGERRLLAVDATCPLVTKVHREALRFARDGSFVLLVGHRNHDEVVGTLGHVPPDRIALVEDAEQARSVEVPDPERVAVITQTTLSVEEAREVIDVLKARFPALREPARGDICYATTNRQEAVKALATAVDLVIVVGSENSSNSQRLRECAEQAGRRAFLVDHPDQVEAAWLEGATTIGVTAGASSPESLVEAIIARIRDFRGELPLAEFGAPEPEIVFTPPPELVALRRERAAAVAAAP